MPLTKKMLIGGEWTSGSGNDVVKVINPATEEIFATVPKATKQDVDQAIKAANEAFKTWSKTTPFYRGDILRKASNIVLEKAEEIAKLMTQEQGKPFKEALGEVKKGAEILRYYAEEGERVYGRIIPSSDGNIESRVIYQPIGVAVAISPWNYPIELIAWKLGGALASGCTIVCKLPSETPISPTTFVECILEAGLPKGVVNIVTGPGSESGPVFAKDPLVRKIAFTGSTRVGKELFANTTDTLKRISLELGGNLPMIVTKNCDLEAAVAGATRRSFRNMGQICIAVNRIYIDETIYEDFLEKFKDDVTKLTIGNGLTEDVDLGPMCSPKGLATTQKHIKDALDKGARLVCGGKKPEGKAFKKGYFFEPTILADVNHEMLIMKEETFGPAVGVMPYKTIEEVIELANDTVYGLAAIVYSNNLSEVDRLSKELQAGNVAINNPDPGVVNAPYGGWKDSGIGHEHGPEGLYEYLNIKHIRVKCL